MTLIHPGLWDSRTWDPQLPVLVDAAYRVVRYDVRGYGRSSRLTGEPYSHVRDLAALLDFLERAADGPGRLLDGRRDRDRLHAGASRTGSTALVVAASGLGGFEAIEEEEDWWDGAERADRGGDRGRGPGARRGLRLEVWAPLGTDDAAGAADPRIAFDNIHELTMDESGEEELDPPAALRLGEIDVPTLVMIAEHDPPYMRRTGDLIARGDPRRAAGGDRGRRPRGEPAPARWSSTRALLAFLDGLV